MTVDLEVIRQALADAKPLYNETMVMSDSLADAIDSLYANAPVWLAQLCDEIERLRNTQQLDPYGVANRWHDERDAALVDLNQHKSALHDMSVDFAVLEQRLDAALAKLDGYRSDHAALMAERNAALAECERLRALCEAKS